MERVKSAFDRRLDVRLKHGATGHRLSRRVDDPGEYELVIDFASLGGARGYAEDVSRMELQRLAGVEGGAHDHRHWDESIRETVDAASYH